jgi:hypothetical protein
MFYQSIQPFLEPIFSWLCCPDNCSQQVFTPLPPVFSFQDAIYNPNVYVLLSLSSLIGLALSSVLMDYSLYRLSQSAPGSSSLAVFNILLFRLKPNFLLLQNISVIFFFVATCFSLDLFALGDLYEAFNIAWTSQQVMFPQAQIMLAALVVFCSFVGTTLFHTLLCSALHLVKVKGDDFKPRAIVFTLLCDSLNLVTLACCIIHVLYLGAYIQLN